MRSIRRIFCLIQRVKIVVVKFDFRNLCNQTFFFLPQIESDEPSCVTPIQTIPANIGSVVTMVCEVRSNPWRNVQFRWQTKHRELALKSSQDDNASVPKMIDSRQKYSRIFSTLTSSPTRIVRNRLAIRIESSDDFGQYQCWAHNDVGEQREPCLYNIYGRYLFNFSFFFWEKFSTSRFSRKQILSNSIENHKSFSATYLQYRAALINFLNRKRTHIHTYT